MSNAFDPPCTAKEQPSKDNTTNVSLSGTHMSAVRQRPAIEKTKTNESKVRITVRNTGAISVRSELPRRVNVTPSAQLKRLYLSPEEESPEREMGKRKMATYGVTEGEDINPNQNPYFTDFISKRAKKETLKEEKEKRVLNRLRKERGCSPCGDTRKLTEFLFGEPE
ncbi:hypothetical protein RUM44_000867 [Polyplax serrata]|uniref:Uncharacterized protein n=1 Tax=Polyplax serrata TaxID=468196 RepID=A0ABR1B6B4_POLSC